MFVCVLAIAAASVLHVGTDFSEVHADTLSIGTAHADPDRPAAGGAVEICHLCAVVSLFATPQGSEHDVIGGPIPAGRLPPLLSYLQPVAGPPPKILT